MKTQHASKKIVSLIFSKLPLSILATLTRTRLLIPYYHMISDTQVAHVKHLYTSKSTRQFREDLDLLLEHYTAIGLAELLNYRTTGRQLPDRVFLLTFDDGFREMHDIVAPILLEKGISATFFVNTAFIGNQQLCYLNKASLIVERLGKVMSSSLNEKVSGMLSSQNIVFNNIQDAILAINYQRRDLLDEIASVIDVNISEYLALHQPYLTQQQISKLLHNGFTIGAHSIDHPLYSALSVEDQLYQTIESVKCIREMFGLSYGVFAFPHSDKNVSAECFAQLEKSGLIDLSFGTAGLVDDSIANHLQRFSLEKPMERADRIIGFQYARKLSNLVRGRSRIMRL